MTSRPFTLCTPAPLSVRLRSSTVVPVSTEKLPPKTCWPPATTPGGPGRGSPGADGRVLGGNRLVLADIWAVGAEFDHNWSDQWVSELNGSVLDVDQAGRRYDFRNIDAQLNLSFAPVKDLKFTAEGEYKYIDRTKGRDGNAFVMMFIVERDF